MLDFNEELALSNLKSKFEVDNEKEKNKTRENNFNDRKKVLDF